MPRVTRGPRRPPRHAWHRLAQASLAGPAPASLPAIMAAPALAIGAAEEASGRSFEALSAKMNVLVLLWGILSHMRTAMKMFTQLSDMTLRVRAYNCTFYIVHEMNQARGFSCTWHWHFSFHAQ